MPRTARLDITGVLQHVIVRGVERRDIFLDDIDRQLFLDRFSNLLVQTETECLAWSLMTNHVHMLLRPAKSKLGNFMRRLLTGYAVTFNLHHHRSGHLFQNRFKSIICEEDPYLLELVRYIHLNPLRVGIVSSMAELNEYPWSGHAVLMGRREMPGQNVEEVLRYFGKRAKTARKKYQTFVEDGISLGRREELVGGGLMRVLKLAGNE
jgi:putative transposase